MNEIIVDDEDSLRAFRADWLAPSVMLEALNREPVVLINLPVGVGKSHLLDDLLDHLRISPQFDVVIVLAEQTDSLMERRLLQNPPQDVLRLRPRPREDCGALDSLWCRFEQSGCTAYAKEILCKGCSNYPCCFWPGQYGEALRGSRILFGTHAQLRINPFLF